MALNSNKREEDGGSLPNQDERLHVPSLSSEERPKTIRRPRWTRHETLVLIEGKNIVEKEARYQKSRRSIAYMGSEPVEPKWDLVSSHCKQHGVSREPIQCRKRWSNLLVDFKKIRNWETRIQGEMESYWVMRNDLRRDKKLPGFFDREVYNVLDGQPETTTSAFPLAVLCPLPLDSRRVYDGAEEAAAEEEEEDDDDDEEEDEPKRFFDSNRKNSTENGVFSDYEDSRQEKLTGTPTKTFTTPVPTPGTVKGKRRLGSDTWGECVSQEKWKQRWLSIDGSEDNYSDHRYLINVLENNSKMLTAQLEAHNKNCQLDREQSKEQTEKMLTAIKNVTHALARIADKLDGQQKDATEAACSAP